MRSGSHLSSFSSSSSSSSSAAASSSSVADIPNLLKKAESLMRPAGFFSTLLGRGTDFDAALSIYTQCAQRYKMARLWQESADCYVRASIAAQRMEDRGTEGQMLVEAGNVLKRVSALDAQEQLEAAAQVYIQQGRWGQAAKIYRSIAEMYEEEGCHTTSSSASSCSSSGLGVGGGLGGSSPSMLLDSGGGDSMNKVMTFYRKAAETYELDEYGKSAYSQCRCKYAEYAAKNDNTIDEALRIFEQEGDKATRNNLLQFSAKDFYLKALVLLLASGDAVSAKIALERYMARDPRLEGSREGRLASSLVEAMSEGDAEAFTAAIEEYDRISKLDPWKIHFLLRAKRKLLHGDAGGEGAGGAVVGEDGEVDLS